MCFDTNHLNFFVKCLSDDLPIWVGDAPSRWAKHVLGDGRNVEALPDRPLSRSDLYELARDEKISDYDFAACVLAWGGMNRTHGRMLFVDHAPWVQVVGRLRANQINSIEAYKEFKLLRLNGRLPGMRPAFFTKLIFFSAPAHDGFIMDQWTARSANLLMGKELVRTVNLTPRANDLNSQTVSDQNDEGIYEEFCKLIFNLARETGYEGREAKIEEALFSTGRGKGRWRNYVVANG